MMIRSPFTSLLLITFVLTMATGCQSAFAGGAGIPTSRAGIGFGNLETFSGIRINWSEKDIQHMNGINFSVWASGDENDGFYRGITMGLLTQEGGSFKGITLAGFGISSGNLSGIAIGGLGVGAGDVAGIIVGGLGVGAENITGISIGGLGVGAKNIKGMALG